MEDVHTLALAYRWTETDVLRLRLGRRLQYLLLLEREQDGKLLAGILE